MPSAVRAGVDVVAIPGLTITEYFGNASTGDGAVSCAHVKITEAQTNPWQTPEFCEHIMMISGEAHVEHSGGTAVVKAGEGLILPAGCRVKWSFPGPAEYVPICTPAFSPENVHREEGEATDGEPPAVPAHATSHPPRVLPNVDVVKAPTLTITEYFGNVASTEPHFSSCVAKVDEPCAEAWQKPEFAEWVLVLSGTLHLEHADGLIKVPAGSGVFLEPNDRVKWVWPEPCIYVPVCMPAFTPDGCHREAEEGSAKDADPETMERLNDLHKAAAA